MLAFAIVFNLWLYHLEPTSLVDPNDNAFQYALVDRTNQIWEFASGKCSLNVLCFFSYLVDHWVPNWAQGYNLPFYYSHIPQILIVASWRLFSTIQQFSNLTISLFTYYHIVIYLLMSLFPLSVFLSLRLIRLPWLTAGIGALLASQISTDGLYGLDPPSFLFRGWGLSSQLFAMVWLPLAIAYAWRYFQEAGLGLRYQVLRINKKMYQIPLILNTKTIPPIFFLVATTMGHLGIGFIAMLSLIPLAIPHSRKDIKKNILRLTVLSLISLFFLSYWIVPIFLHGDYHNVSFWDPVWKFDSFGWRLTMDRLLSGELFDWGRFPWLTLLVFIGIFASVLPSSNLTIQQFNNRENADGEYKFSNFPFGLLFIFWLVLYFGRSTWGGLIDLIPGMSEFHISRFIVGLHLAGLFLIPIGIQFVFQQFSNLAIQQSNPIVKLLNGYVVSVALVIGLAFVVYPQTIRYAQHNDFLISQANENYKKAQPDLENLFTTLKSLPPGRVYAGRGGNWGKDFRVAETTMFMHLSTYGVPVVLWLPETWSPNSDIEQYFSDDIESHYSLFGIRYIVAPPDITPQPFWKLLKENNSWNLYEVNTSYITAGVRPAIVSSSKFNYINVVRLWIQSDTHEQDLYPEITFAKDFPRPTGLPNFRMLDEVTYKVPDLPAEALAKAGGSTHNLFAEPPVYMPSEECNNDNNLTILSQQSEADMIFKTTVEVKEGCNDSIVILRQSSHPNWRATLDQNGVQPLTVFPFFVAVPVTAGTHEIIFSYEPSGLKIFLLTLEFLVLAALIVFYKKHHQSYR